MKQRRIGNMTDFWDLLERSIIVQSLITFGLIVTACVLWITNRPVPPDMMQILTIVVAFWMGSKVQQAVANTARKMGVANDVRDSNGGASDIS